MLFWAERTGCPASAVSTRPFFVQNFHVSENFDFQSRESPRQLSKILKPKRWNVCTSKYRNCDLQQIFDRGFYVFGLKDCKQIASSGHFLWAQIVSENYSHRTFFSPSWAFFSRRAGLSKVDSSGKFSVLPTRSQINRPFLGAFSFGWRRLFKNKTPDWEHIFSPIRGLALIMRKVFCQTRAGPKFDKKRAPDWASRI